jgi:hypothetical protein
MGVKEALERVNVELRHRRLRRDPLGEPGGCAHPAGARIVGDVRGRQFTSVVAPEDARRAREVFARKVVGNESVTDAQVAVVDLDGDRVPVEVSSIPLVRGAHVVGVLASSPTWGTSLRLTRSVT